MNNIYFDPKYYDSKYFNAMAPGNYSYFCKTKGTGLLDCRLNDLRKVKISPGMKVLDIGCGRGELVMYLAYKGVIAVGFDYASEAINIAKECLRFYNKDVINRFMIIQACAEAMPFNNVKFDRIMSWANVEHLYQDQWLKCIKHAYCILNDNGVIIIGTHPNEWLQKYVYMATRNIRQIIQRKKMKTVKERIDDERNEGHVNIKNPISLKRDMLSAGFYVKVFVTKTFDISNQPIIQKIALRVLENMPILKWLFRDNIVAVGAKTQEALNAYLKINNDNIIGYI